ncbi:TIGR03862 family flavoprotein [Desulfatiferula olefinivorans]
MGGTAAVIGAGPAGLMAAEVLLEGGLDVTLYEAMPRPGLKFLVAGRGGLNYTRNDHHDALIAAYGSAGSRLGPILSAFGPDDLRRWMSRLGFESFEGNARRVFPVIMGATPILRAWLDRLTGQGLSLCCRHVWRGWDSDQSLVFETPRGRRTARADLVVLAMGGAARPRLGSTGLWAEVLAHRGVSVNPFKPANCGFDVTWSDHFRQRFSGRPIKPVVLTITDSGGRKVARKGELLVTKTGLEGGLIYGLSAPLREAVAARGTVTVHLDLCPDRTVEHLAARLAQPRGARSLAGHLERKTGIREVKAGLIREVLSPQQMADPARLTSVIKALPLTLTAPRPLSEAISSAGGLPFDQLDEHLMIRRLPGVFCAGEMLDWEAPTGGYLLTACFALGRAAGRGALAWYQARMGARTSK